MTSFKEFLTEKMTPLDSSFSDLLSGLLSQHADVEEMRNSRCEISKTGTIEVRFKPKKEDTDRAELLNKIETVITKKSKQLKIADIKINKQSPNSGKFPSVAFNKDDKIYDIVLALGANRGEKFESDILLSLEDKVAGLDSAEADSLLDAMELADKKFKRENVIGVSARSGSTARYGSKDPGAVIADIILKMEDESKKYLSIKNQEGLTFANLGGVAAMFDSEFNIKTSSDIWKILKEFGCEAKKISRGLRAYVSKEEVDFEVNISKSKTLAAGGVVEDFLLNAWGYGYYYVKQHGNKFKVLNMTKQFVKNKLLKNLKVEEIRYPFADSKQASVKFGNEFASYKLEIRNPHGPGAIKPTDAKIKITRLNLD